MEKYLKKNMLIGLMNNKTNIMWKGFNMEKNIDIYNKKYNNSTEK